jgi:hypothetical protein
VVGASCQHAIKWRPELAMSLIVKKARRRCSTGVVVIRGPVCHAKPPVPPGGVDVGGSFGSLVSQARASSRRTIESRPAFVTDERVHGALRP